MEREDWLIPEIIPRRKGALLPEAAAGRTVPRLCPRGQGDLDGGGGPSRSFAYCFGKAKSQAVSCAHFHMACMRRVKPMSLGFSSPLISRCFMMETNSLLLSSPLPGGRSKHNRDKRRPRNRDTEKIPLFPLCGFQSPAPPHGQIQFSLLKTKGLLLPRCFCLQLSDSLV